MPRLPFALAFLLFPVATSLSVAQQRESKIEVDGLAGVCATEVRHGLWRPEEGAGVLLPLGSKRAAPVDASVGIAFLSSQQLAVLDRMEEAARLMPAVQEAVCTNMVEQPAVGLGEDCGAYSGFPFSLCARPPAGNSTGRIPSPHEEK